MKDSNLTQLTNEELLAKHKSAKTLQWVVMGIFAILIIAWVFMGYWKENIPVFIIQIVLAVGVTVVLQAPLTSIKKEMEIRGM